MKNQEGSFLQRFGKTRKPHASATAKRFLYALAMALLSAGTAGAAEHFFTSPNLPPLDGMYVTSQQFHALYGNGIILSNVTHRLFTESSPPPPIGGAPQQHVFSSQVEFLVSTDGGRTFLSASAPAQVRVLVSPAKSAAGGPVPGLYDTEMLQLDITGGNLPAGAMIRESPSRASLGRTSSRQVNGGYMLDSVFDIYTELTLDGGKTWQPSQQAAHVELRGDPTATPSVAAPTQLLPPPNDLYVSPALYHVLYTNGIVIRDIKHRFFTQSLPAPLPGGPPRIHEFGSQVDMEVSTDGGQTFRFMRAPASAAVQVSYRGNFGSTQIYDTEMLSLNISGGDLPANVRLRESPTLASQGGTAIARNAGSDTFMISGFFDINTEVSVNGGQTWTPADGAAHVILSCNAPEVPEPSENLPPLEDEYVSVSDYHAAYAAGIIIKDIKHHRFTQSQPPPPSGGIQTHQFDSQIDFQVSLNGGETFSPGSAPAHAVVLVRSSTDIGPTRFFDTEMLQLNIAGGSLPPGVMLRESPTRASLGRTSIRMVTDPAGSIWDYVSSSFVIFTELSVDGGQRWAPSTTGPGEVVLKKANGPMVVETDVFPNSLAQITLSIPNRGTETLNLSGPTTVNVFFEGKEGGASDTDNDGLDQVKTEITLFEVKGSSPTLGPVTVRLRSPNLPPYQHTVGEIEEMENLTRGMLDVMPFANTGKANSYFNVFFEIEVGGRIYYNPVPKRMQSVITHKPPAPGETDVGDTPVELVDENGNPTGIIVGASRHTPNPKKVEVDLLENTGAVVGLRMPDGSLVNAVLSGPTTINVALDSLGDREPNGLEEVSTEIVAMNLSGGGFQLLAGSANGLPPTRGLIEEKRNIRSGRLDLHGPDLPFCGPTETDCNGTQASSSFDVLFAVITPAGLRLHNIQPLRMEAMIDQKPPRSIYTHVITAPIELFDDNNNPTGVFLVSANHDTRPKPVVITCPPDILARTTGNGATVEYTVQASGGCGTHLTVVCLPPSGSLFSLGETPVTCTASDDCQQSSTCAFTVRVFSKTTQGLVAEYIRTHVLGGSLDQVTLWMTPTALDQSHIARDLDPQVPDLRFPYPQNWLVMIDDLPEANFGHRVRWLLVDDNLDRNTEPLVKQFPPTVWGALGAGKQIDFRCAGVTPKPCPSLDLIPLKDIYRYVDGKDCLHAVLISGGINNSANYSRYPQNLRSMYQKLRACGFRKANIFVYYADGRALDCDNLDGDGNDATGSDVTGAATEANIRPKIQNLAASLNPNRDVLLVYTSNHGADNKGLCLWDSSGNGQLEANEIYSPAEFGSDTANAKVCRLFGIFDQCYSGEFNSIATDGLHPHTAIYSAATDFEPSWGREYMMFWEALDPSTTTLSALHASVTASMAGLGHNTTFGESAPGVGNVKLCRCWTSLRITAAISRVIVAFDTEAGLIYELQATDSLSRPAWKVLKTITGNGGIAEVEEPNNGKTRFYRVREPDPILPSN